MFEKGEKFGVVTWDWKRGSPDLRDVKKMEDRGLNFRKDVPEEIIYQDCYAAIFSERVLSEEEAIFAWKQCDNYYTNQESLIEEIGGDNNIYEIFDTTLEERNPQKE